MISCRGATYWQIHLLLVEFLNSRISDNILGLAALFGGAARNKNEGGRDEDGSINNVVTVESRGSSSTGTFQDMNRLSELPT